MSVRPTKQSQNVNGYSGYSKDLDRIYVNMFEQIIKIDFSEQLDTMKIIQNELLLNQGESSKEIRVFKSGVVIDKTDYQANIYIFNEDDMSECIFQDELELSTDDTFIYSISGETTIQLDRGFYNVILQLKSDVLGVNNLAKLKMRIMESEYVFN